MASAYGTATGISGIIMIIVGIALTIAGIILYMRDSNDQKLWYTWVMLIVGIVVLVIGIIFLIAASSKSKQKTVKQTTEKSTA